MEAKADQQLGQRKVSARTEGAATAVDTVPAAWVLGLGTMYLVMPKVRQSGYIPFLQAQ